MPPRAGSRLDAAVESLPALAAAPPSGATLQAEVAAHRLGRVVAALPGLRRRWRSKDVVLARNLQCVVAGAGRRREPRADRGAPKSVPGQDCRFI